MINLRHLALLRVPLLPVIKSVARNLLTDLKLFSGLEQEHQGNFVPFYDISSRIGFDHVGEHLPHTSGCCTGISMGTADLLTCRSADLDACMIPLLSTRHGRRQKSPSDMALIN